jgi:hypothetical protein
MGLSHFQALHEIKRQSKFLEMNAKKKSSRIQRAYPMENHPTFCGTTLFPSPITVVAQSEAWTVFAHSNAGIVGSNPTQSMDIFIVWVYSVFVLSCV